MNNEEKDINKMNEDTRTGEDLLKTEDVNNQLQDANNTLADDIIRNDTIPETSKDTPGSIGAFPVGAFENNKD